METKQWDLDWAQQNALLGYFDHYLTGEESAWTEPSGEVIEETTGGADENTECDLFGDQLSNKVSHHK